MGTFLRHSVLSMTRAHKNQDPRDVRGPSFNTFNFSIKYRLFGQSSGDLMTVIAKTKKTVIEYFP